MARSAEAGAGDQQQVEVLGPLTEGHVVRLQRAGEQIEGSAGLGHMIAHLPQGGDQQLAVALVHRQVSCHIAAQRGDLLEQAGGVHIAQGAAGSGHGGIDLLSVRDLSGHQHIAQALAGQGQGLGEGVAHDGVLVNMGHPGHLKALEHDLPIGLVRDEIDGVTVLLTLGGEDSGELLQSLAGIDHAGGVVGGVYHHALGVGGDGALQGVEVDLEVLDLRGDQHHFGPGPLDEYFILREIGGKYDELVPRAGQAVEHAAQRGRRAHGDVKLVGGVAALEAAVQGVGKALPGGGIALGAGVAVDQLGLLLQNADGRLVDGVGGGDAGVAQGEVEHILRTHHGGPLLAILKQLPDHRPGSAQAQHTLVDHDQNLLHGKQSPREHNLT